MIFCYFTLFVTLLEVGLMYWICSRAYIPKMPTEEELAELKKSISKKAKVIENIEKVVKEEASSEEEKEDEEKPLSLSSSDSSESEVFNPNIERFNQILEQNMVKEVYIMGIKFTEHTLVMTEEQKQLKEIRDRKEKEMLEKMRRDYEERKMIKRNLRRLKRAMKRYKKFKEKRTVVKKKKIKKFFNNQINIFGAKKQNISKKKKKEILEENRTSIDEEVVSIDEDNGLLQANRRHHSRDKQDKKSSNKGSKLLELSQRSKNKHNMTKMKTIKEKLEEETEKETEVFFLGEKNLLDEWFLEIITSDILLENLNVPFVKYYNLIFNVRYMVIQTILVSGQAFGVLQCIALFLIQGWFIFKVVTTQKKYGLYENNFVKLTNLVQEISLLVFLAVSVIISVLAFRQRDLNDFNGYDGYTAPVGGTIGFGLEFIGVVSIVIAFLTEVFSMLIMIFGIIIFVFKFIKTHYKKIFCFCCLKKEKKKKEDEKKKEEGNKDDDEINFSDKKNKEKLYKKMAELLIEEKKLKLAEEGEKDSFEKVFQGAVGGRGGRGFNYGMRKPTLKAQQSRGDQEFDFDF